MADEIAYNNHDVDDGLRAGLLSFEQLTECDLFLEQFKYVNTKWPNLEQKRLKHELIRRMINKVVVDLIHNSKNNIQDIKLEKIEDVRNIGHPLISLSDETNALHKQLKQFLSHNLYQHKRVKRISDEAKEIVANLFHAYMDDPSKLSLEVRNRISVISGTNNDISRARVIADYMQA